MALHRAAAKLSWATAASLLLALLGALLLWGKPLYSFLADQEAVRAWVGQFGPWAPAAVSLLEIAQVLLAPIPGQAIEAAAGYLFGFWRGALCAMIGIAAGSTLNFSLTRLFGRRLAVRLAGSRSVARLDDLAERGGPLFFFLLWLFPFVPDDLACLAAGLTPMPTRQFLALMLLGRLPGILVSTWVGAHAGQIPPLWWGLVFAGLSLFALTLWQWGGRLQALFLDLAQRLQAGWRGRHP